MYAHIKQPKEEKKLWIVKCYVYYMWKLYCTLYTNPHLRLFSLCLKFLNKQWIILLTDSSFKYKILWAAANIPSVCVSLALSACVRACVFASITTNGAVHAAEYIFKYCKAFIFFFFDRLHVFSRALPFTRCLTGTGSHIRAFIHCTADPSCNRATREKISKWDGKDMKK